MEHDHLPPCYAPLHRCLLSLWWVSLYCKGTVRRCNVAGSVNHSLYSNSQGALPRESTGFGPALLAPDACKSPAGLPACRAFCTLSSKAAGQKLRTTPQAAAFAAEQGGLPQAPFAAAREA